MAYVAVKGGEAAIEAAHTWLAEQRRGDPQIPDLTILQIDAQLGRAADRVMGEGSLYDRELASLAIKQSQGDLVEAIFLLRAYRTTLPRFGYSQPIDTNAMVVVRRVSAILKDLPGGQRLGPTYDYTHRLLDFSLSEDRPLAPAFTVESHAATMPCAIDILSAEGLIESDSATTIGAPEINSVGVSEPEDLTRNPLDFPVARDLRLQALSRGDEGFLLSMAYSTQRGYGGTHPFVGEIRVGAVSIEFVPPELGFSVDIGDIVLTECQMVNQFAGSKTLPAQFTRGYGLVFGHSERKSIAMALVDRSLRTDELGEDVNSPAQDVEFVLSHCDNVEATGFVEHLKLPHYVDFQSELELIRQLRHEAEAQPEPAE